MGWGLPRILLPCIALSLGLSASAADARDLKQGLHSIAIVSLLGDEISFGAFGLGNGQTVPDAGFDDTADHALWTSLSQDIPGTVLVNVDLPKDELMRAAYGRPMGDSDLRDVRQLLAAWTATHPVDLVIIVARSGGELFPENSHYSIHDVILFHGIGFYGGSSPPMPVAFIGLMVCDGKTLEPLAQSSVRELMDHSSEFTWSDTRHLSTEKIAMISKDLTAMIETAVPGLVHQAGL